MAASRHCIALAFLACMACSSPEASDPASGPVDETAAASNTSGSDSAEPGEPGDRNTVAQTDAGTIKNGLYRIKVEIPILRDTSIDAETSDALRPQMADAINSNPDWNFCITDKQTVRGDWTELMMKIGADQRATCIKKSDTSTAATIEAAMECLEPSPKNGSLSLESSMQFRFSGDGGAIQGNMSKISTDKTSGGQATLGMAVDMQHVGSCEA